MHLEKEIRLYNAPEEWHHGSYSKLVRVEDRELVGLAELTEDTATILGFSDLGALKTTLEKKYPGVEQYGLFNIKILPEEENHLSKKYGTV